MPRASTPPISSGGRSPSRTSFSNVLDDAQALGARTIEAAVDDALDPRPQRAEGERDDERPGSGDPVRAAADRDARGASVMPMYVAASSSVSVP